MKLAGKVALVTGAGSGIGQGIAKLLAAEGACVGVLDFNPDGVQETIDAITQQGGTAVPLIADVSEASDMRSAVETLVQSGGRLDIIVANAGINGVWAPIDELEPEEWDRTLNVNLKGTFLTFKYSVPHLKKNGGSAIIVSSLHGTRTFTVAGSTAYACTKGAQVIFAKKMALELARYGIRVNAICPGSTKTHVNDKHVKRNLEGINLNIQFPQGKQPLTNRAAEPEEIAPLVLFLTSEESAFITGAEIHIDGGMSLVMG
jgi:NAD(P)-dependent dehydrogenase (short-subunit alcohol dehydrogenase family)